MTHFESKEKVMTTHRSEKKTRWAQSTSRPINFGARRPSARLSISVSQRRKMPDELIYALALTKASGGEG